MKRWRRWLLIGTGGLLLFGALYVAFSFLFLDFFVDRWWFKSLGYEGFFWLRLLYRYLVFGLVVLLFFSIFFFNFWLASRNLGVKEPAACESEGIKGKSCRDLIQLLRYGSLKVYAPLAILMAIPIALPLFKKWESALLYLFGSTAGVPDPVFGRDISYYLFSYPIYTLIQEQLLISFLILFGGLLFLYWYQNRLLGEKGQPLSKWAKVHLSGLLFLTFLIQAWGFFLQRFELLYSNPHQPLFFGPGFVEMRILLPLIWLVCLSFLGAGLALIVYVNSRKGLKVLLFFVAVFLLSISARHASFLTQTVDKYLVKPNEIIREEPFIRNNIEATLAAYALDDVEIREYPTDRIVGTSWAAMDPDIQRTFSNTPVWDRALLSDVFRQLQGIRPYYEFPSVDVGRYTVNNLYQQVYLGARELNLTKLPEYARNWVNEHLQYTHGLGVVMTPAAQGGDEVMTWFIENIPPRSRYGFSIEQPAIYYGLESYAYVLAPNDVGEINYARGTTDVLVNYRGRGGVPLSSFLRKILFAVYFKDRNIFFTTKTNPKTRILFRRNIVERIRRLTPFLQLDSDPYMVVTAKGLYWIQDAYTVSDRFPNTEPFRDEFNYIRNSVKIIVDAYNGSVTYYSADPKDPVVKAYRRMYPGLIRDLDQMPAQIKPHLRYPKDLFEIQMHIYGKYHQKDPEDFYRQADIWEFAKMYQSNQQVDMSAHYLTLDLIEPGNDEFLLLLPISPRGRDNLRSLGIAGCDGDHYGKLIVYSFPIEQQVFGPSQVSTLIDQDPDIAQQFTLWDQAGSEVKRGKMIVLPVGKKVIFYIQPVYLSSSTALKIPELRRLIVSQGDLVVMDVSLEEAFKKLEIKVKEKIKRIEKRYNLPAASSQTPPRKEAEKEHALPQPIPDSAQPAH